MEIVFEIMKSQARARAIINDESFRHQRMLMPALEMTKDEQGNVKKVGVNDLRIIDSVDQLKYNQERLFSKEEE